MRPRRVREGDEYQAAQLDRGEAELDMPPPRPDPPPEEVRGEPWGWTKPGPKPRGWRSDGRYGDNSDDPS